VSDVVIRASSPSDLAAVADLRWRWVVEDGGGTPVVTRDEFRDAVVAFGADNPAHTCFVAERGGVVVGMAWLAVLRRVPSPRSVARANGDVQCVYVVPEERGSGIASRFMATIVERARELGLERVTVHSSVEGVGTYVRAGFGTDDRHLVLDTAEDRSR
jgi:GNAT superfamily N-acetyltransferase